MKKTIYFILMPFILAAGSADYFQQEVNYTIDVTLNDTDHTLTAFESIEYKNQSPDTLTYIWFHLWPNAYKNTETAYAKQAFKNGSTRFYFATDDTRGYIDSLDFSIDGTKAEWHFHDEWIDVAKIALHEPLLPGKTVTIETPFFVKLPDVYSRLGHTGKHYEITQWYPKPAVYDQYGWHPMPYLNMGEFYSEFGTFDVKITLPENYRIMATGDLINGEKEYAWLDSLAKVDIQDEKQEKKSFLSKLKEKKKKDDDQTDVASKMKTLHFHQENVHDFAWFADPNWIVRKGELFLADSTRSVTLWSMYLPKNAELWEKSIEYIHDAGYWYSKFYGDYPYNHITAVDGDMSAGGGMEYPNITVISSGGSKDILELVIMHEVGHNWFYSILGSDEREHPWMDEGINEYANIKYWEKKYLDQNERFTLMEFPQNKLGIGKNLSFRWALAYMGYVGRANPGNDQPITLASEQINPGNYGSIIYGKTGLCFRYLQHYLGEEKMDEIMQDYYETWKFKHPYPEDFQTIVKSNVSEDLSWFFFDLLNSTNVIDYSIKRQGKVAVISNKGTISSPVEVVFYNKNDHEIQRDWYKDIESNLSIPFPEEAVKAVIDPDDYMPDINRMNNATRHPLNFSLIFDQPDYSKREWYYVPWLGGNAYSGFTPGFVLYSGFIPTYRYGLSITPMWDFKHNKPVGSLSGEYTWYQVSKLRSLALSGGLKDLGNVKSQNLSFSGLIKKPIISSPSLTISGAVYHHEIGEELNPVYYSEGEFTVAEFEAAFYHQVNPLLNYSVSIGGTKGMQDADFSKAFTTFSVDRRWSRSMRSNLRLWVGGFLGDGKIPYQFLNYLGGGVDPHFGNILVLDRSTDAESVFNIFDEQYEEEGPALKGRAIVEGEPIVSREMAWGINLNQSIPKLPFQLFADFAGASDLKDTYFDAGLKIKMGVVSIFVPLYQNWDDDPTPNDLTWVKDRLRFELSMPNINF